MTAAAPAPEWTDRNAHDPGFALLQLFGWIAAGLLFGLGVAYARRRRRVDEP
jgi:hypothetical protein